MHDWKKKFSDFISSKNLFSKKDTVLLAVSGGVDSIVMASWFYECGCPFGMAHANFQLRGKDSEDDESFVKELAEKLKVDFFSTRFQTKEYAADNKLSIQMAARDLRYRWLEEIRAQNGFARIATAHHSDDSAETVLLNIMRGTGIHGLKGIAAKNQKVIRPMLCFSKKEIEEYALLNHVPFRLDSTNLEADYQRNKIRLEVIPTLEKHFPSFKKVFAENILKWADASQLYDKAISQIRKKLLTPKGSEHFISIGALKTHEPYHRTILFELIKEFAFNSEQSEQIVMSLDSEPGKMFFSPSHQLLKDRKNLIISELSNVQVSSLLIHENDKKVSTGNFELHISFHDAKNFSIPDAAHYSCLDAKELTFPLSLRKWKAGDYFYPLGMKKKKKLSNYLIDRKIPLSEKENIWVIESEQRIACIIGERIDERFKITNSTERIFAIELKK